MKCRARRQKACGRSQPLAPPLPVYAKWPLLFFRSSRARKTYFSPCRFLCAGALVHNGHVLKYRACRQKVTPKSGHRAHPPYFSLCKFLCAGVVVQRCQSLIYRACRQKSYWRKMTGPYHFLGWQNTQFLKKCWFSLCQISLSVSRSLTLALYVYNYIYIYIYIHIYIYIYIYIYNYIHTHTYTAHYIYICYTI